MFDLKQILDDKINLFIKENVSEEEQSFLNSLLTYQCVKKKLEELVYKEYKNKRIALYGDGNLTKEFIYAVGIPTNLICIIDKEKKENPFWKLENIPVIAPEKIEEYCIEVILIPSMVYESEIEKELVYREFRGKIIGIHSWIKKQGIVIEGEFYWYKSFTKYKIINQAYCDFKKNGNNEKLKCVILGLFYIRDYMHACELIEKYYKGDEDNVYFILKNDIKKIFQEVRNKILKLNEQHVMMYVVDSLAQSEIKNMPLLQKIAEDNFSLETMIVEYGTTVESLTTLLTGYHLLNNELYKRNSLTKEDGKLFPYLEISKYKFNIFSQNQNFAFSRLSQLKYNTGICTELFFEGLCEVLKSKQNTFNCIHNEVELHPPFWNPLYGENLLEYDETYYFDEFMRQYRSSQKYMDEICYFYYELLNSSHITQVILGDHGILLENSFAFLYESLDKMKYGNQWDYKKINPVCIIINDGLGKGKNKNVICNYSIPVLLQKILSKQISGIELEKYDDRYIILEFLPIYNKKHIERWIEIGNFEWIIGGIGIWTKKDVFIRLETKEERYFVHGIEGNLIDSGKYQERIIECRNLLKDNPGMESILSYNKFSYHRKVVGIDAEKV